MFKALSRLLKQICKVAFVSHPLHFKVEVLFAKNFKKIGEDAFEDISRCPVGELFGMSHCLKTVTEVNAATIMSQSHEKGQRVVVFGIHFEALKILNLSFLLSSMVFSKFMDVPSHFCKRLGLLSCYILFLGAGSLKLLRQLLLSIMALIWILTNCCCLCFIFSKFFIE